MDSDKGSYYYKSPKISVAGRPLVQEPRLLVEAARCGRPLYLLKMALSLDGKIAPARKSSSEKADCRPFYLSNRESRRLVHRIRGILDGVMVGADTVRSDNPRLDCRLTGGRNPYKIVVTSTGDLPLQSNVFSYEPEKVIIASTGRITQKRKGLFEKLGAAVVVCREEEGRVDLADLSTRLKQKKINSVLLEGGAELAASALKKKLIDRVIFFYAPLIMGRGAVESVGNLEMSYFSGIMLEDVKISRLADNFLIDGYPSRV